MTNDNFYFSVFYLYKVYRFNFAKFLCSLWNSCRRLNKDYLETTRVNLRYYETKRLNKLVESNHTHSSVCSQFNCLQQLTVKDGNICKSFNLNNFIKVLFSKKLKAWAFLRSRSQEGLSVLQNNTTFRFSSLVYGLCTLPSFQIHR